MRQKYQKTSKSWFTKLKHPSQFSKPQFLLFVIAFGLIGYFIYHALASSPLVASLEAEQMRLPAGGTVVTNSTASAGKAIKLTRYGKALGSINFPSLVNSITVMAKGTQCKGAPTMTVALDNTNLLTNKSVSATSWTAYTFILPASIASGAHKLSISFNNAYSYSGHDVKGGTCKRVLFADVTNFYGPIPPPPPAPTVTLSASPTTLSSGQSSTLTWTSTNATSCAASGDWSGGEPTSGSTSTGASTQTSTYSLTCTGAGGNATGSVTVTLTSGTGGAVAWRGDYETGDFSQWWLTQFAGGIGCGGVCGPAQIGSGTAAVVTFPVAQGKYAAKFVDGPHTGTPPCNCDRTEVLATQQQSGGYPGQDWYYGWYTDFPGPSQQFWPNGDGWNDFAQFFSTGGSAWITVGIAANDGMPKIYTDGPYGHTILANPLRYDHFYHFVVHAIWSTDSSTGLWELWMDGAKLMSFHGATLQDATIPENSNYTVPGMVYSQGFYRGASTFTNTVIQDGMCRASDYTAASAC